MSIAIVLFPLALSTFILVHRYAVFRIDRKDLFKRGFVTGVLVTKSAEIKFRNYFDSLNRLAGQFVVPFVINDNNWLNNDTRRATAAIQKQTEELIIKENSLHNL